MSQNCVNSSSQVSANDSQVYALNSQLDISLLTCQPHNEVYSLYGHTAIRINNKVTGEDIAVNYGVFDPSAGWFVLRFIFGLTDYSMGVCTYEDFLNEYRNFGSGVYEQRINMTPSEKANFLAAILKNSQPENRIYRYNYFYNNCTTRARDIIIDALDGEVHYEPTTHLQKGKRSFRQLIHFYNENHRWARVGNDLLLGFQADENTSHDEREFLPAILACDFDSAIVINPDGTRKTLVDSAYWAIEPVLLPGEASNTPNAQLSTLSSHLTTLICQITPLNCSWIVFCAILALVIAEMRNLKRGRWNFKCLTWIHYFIFSLYAIPGIILFLMLFSQHPTVRLNLQIFIFCPLWLVLAIPKIYLKWGRWVILSFLIIFFFGNFFQDYAEGTNILALSLLTTFLPDYFVNSKKISNFAR